MSELELDKCPCCGSDRTTEIRGRNDSGYGCLNVSLRGSIDLDLCLNCGNVYIKKKKLDTINYRLEEHRKKYERD